MKTKLFASLKKIREFERAQLPFVRSILDFDLIIEIGYAEELAKPLTPKQVFLLELGSPTTVRRRLAGLVRQGIIVQQANKNDGRSSILTVAPRCLKVLTKYGRLLTMTFVN